MSRVIELAARPYVLGLALVVLLLCGAPARASQAAEAYVQRLANDVTAIINNAALSKEQKNTELGALLDKNIDVKTIGLFTLGQYRHDPSEAELAAYLAAFHDYLIAFYVKNLGRLRSATFKVTGSIDLSVGKGTVVKSIASGDNGEPMEINWRVFNDSSVQDVQIAGAWMALALREQMVAVIEANRGKIPAATAKLREIVASLSS